MQFHIEIFLFIILLSVSSLSQWERVHRPRSEDLFSTVFVSEDIGFVGGENLFATTTDGGRSWFTINRFDNHTIRGLDFINETHGVAVGQIDINFGGILCYTTNSGIDWDYVFYSQYGPFTDVFLLDSLHGWAISDYGHILKINSGIDDWEAVASLDITPQDIYFLNENIGWVTGSGYPAGVLLKTTDGGENWTKIDIGEHNPFKVFFLNENVGWLTAFYRKVLLTTDGGNTWTEIQLPTTGRDIRFFSDSLGYIAGSAGLLKTTDGGNTWIYQVLSSTYYFTGAEFYDENIVNLIGSDQNMQRTTNGGNDWFHANLSEFNELNSIHMCNGANGVAVGNYGTILRTSTGDEWVSGICSTYCHLNSVFTFDNNTAIAVGDSGIILKSINSAYFNWTEKPSGVINNLNSISFIDNDIGWIAGDGGLVLKTTDGGESWNQFSGGTSMDLNSVSFSNHFHGWAAGNGGVIKTTDGGANWFQQSIPNDDYLCIQMFDSNGGYVLGQDGKLFRTYNGGLGWDSIYTAPYAYPWHSFSFYNMWIGWLSGGLGRIYYTQNIGVDWALQHGLNIGDINTIQAIDSQVVYAAGGGGYILRTSNGGIPVPVELISFIGIQEKGHVYLKWQTATELNNSMFEVQRKTEDTDWLAIGYIPGAGTTTEQQHYEHIDDCYGVPGGSNLIYRLKQIDFNGDFEYSDEISIEKLILKEYRLYQNYPNPFNASTSFKYSIPVESIVTLEILDVLGKQTALLVNESKNAGVYETVWNAADVSSGIYFIRIRAGSFSETKKMLLLK